MEWRSFSVTMGNPSVENVRATLTTKEKEGYVEGDSGVVGPFDPMHYTYTHIPTGFKYCEVETMPEAAKLILAEIEKEIAPYFKGFVDGLAVRDALSPDVLAEVSGKLRVILKKHKARRV